MQRRRGGERNLCSFCKNFTAFKRRKKLKVSLKCVRRHNSTPLKNRFSNKILRLKFFRKYFICFSLSLSPPLCLSLSSPLFFRLKLWSNSLVRSLKLLTDKLKPRYSNWRKTFDPPVLLYIFLWLTFVWTI